MQNPVRYFPDQLYISLKITGTITIQDIRVGSYEFYQHYYTL